MRWTDEQIAELRRLAGEDKTSTKIAALTGISRQAVLAKARREGITLIGADPVRIAERAAAQQAKRAEILKMLRAGDCVLKISRVLRVDHKVIREIRNANNIPIRRGKLPAPQPAPKPKRRPAPKPKPVVVVAPVAPPPVTDDAVMVRGTRGVWTAPIGRTVQQIERIASDLGYPYGGVADLPAFNKFRVNQYGFPPLAVAYPKREGTAPLPGVLLAGLPR